MKEIMQIQEGEKEPCPHSKRGRPPKNNLEQTKIEDEKDFINDSLICIEKKKQEIIDCILKEIKNKLNEIL